jgi:hypothetical protein
MVAGEMDMCTAIPEREWVLVEVVKDSIIHFLHWKNSEGNKCRGAEAV